MWLIVKMLERYKAVLSQTSQTNQTSFFCPQLFMICCSSLLSVHPVKIVIINVESSNVKPMIYFRDCFTTYFSNLFKHWRKQNNSTWLVVNTCHRPPADTPTRKCTTAIRGEHQVDGVASASYGRWQGGANTLASDQNVAIVPTALLHQSCPVAVRDCQVVPVTDGIILGPGGIEFNVKCSEF